MEGAADTSFYTDLVQPIILDDVPYLQRLLHARPYGIDADIPFLCFPLGRKEELMVLSRTPLMIAAMTNSPKVVKYLLGCGKANVGKVSPSDGATAYDCAVEAECSPTIINMLHDARLRMAQPMDFNDASHTSFLPSTPSHGQYSFDSTSFARGAAGEMPFSSNHQVDWNVLEWKRPNIMASPYGAVGERPTSSNHRLHRNINISMMQGWKEQNIMTSPYGAVGETPLSSNDQIYQKKNSSVHGRQAEVMINSSAPDPGFMTEYVHSPGNVNSRMQEREEPNIPTPSDATDPSLGRTSSSDDLVHQNMKEVQDSDAVINPSTLENAAVVSEEPNIPTPSDARDPSLGRTSSSDDLVHQNMKEVQDSDAVINPSTLENAAVVSEEPNIPTPSDARDPSLGRTSSSDDLVHQNMKEVQDSDAVINPSTLENAAVVSEDPNIPTPSDARDPSLGRTSSSDDLVHQNMKEVQDSDAVINPSTLENAAVVSDDWLNDFPPLTVGGKLVKLRRRK